MQNLLSTPQQCLRPFKKQVFFLSLLSLIYFSSHGQENGKLSFTINFGLNGNFFVQSYGDPGGPTNKTVFYEKDFIGIVGGAELKYKTSAKSAIGLGYMCSQNKRDVTFIGPFNATNLFLRDFNIRHIENIFHFHFEYNAIKKIPGLYFQLGIFYSRTIQQEIELANYANTMYIDERNFDNSRLNEAGAFFGIQYSWKIDTKFDLGIQSRIFYEISSDILSQVTLTPTLTYHFRKSKKK